MEVMVGESHEHFNGKTKTGEAEENYDNSTLNTNQAGIYENVVSADKTEVMRKRFPV